MEGGRVSHTYCMCIVSHGHGGVGGGRDGGSGRYACGTKSRGLVVCREVPGNIRSER